MAPAPDFAFRGQEAGLCGGRAGGAGDRDGDRVANIAIGHQSPPRQVQAALAGLGIVAHHGEKVSRRTVPSRRKVWGRPMGRTKKTSLISLTPEERRTRPHIGETWGLPVDRAQAVAFSA